MNMPFKCFRSLMLAMLATFIAPLPAWAQQESGVTVASYGEAAEMMAGRQWDEAIIFNNFNLPPSKHHQRAPYNCCTAWNVNPAGPGLFDGATAVAFTPASDTNIKSIVLAVSGQFLHGDKYLRVSLHDDSPAEAPGEIVAHWDVLVRQRYGDCCKVARIPGHDFALLGQHRYWVSVVNVDANKGGAWNFSLMTDSTLMAFGVGNEWITRLDSPPALAVIGSR